MIIFGWGKRTVKNFGLSEEQYCNHCNNRRKWEYRRYITWGTLFFIPVIPYEFLYVKACPICGVYETVSKDDFDEVMVTPTGNRTSHNDSSEGQNDGLTETQRNYRKQMEEFSRSRSDN